MKVSKATYLSFIISFFVWSCSKDSYPSNPRIRIINASPDASSVDFRLQKKLSLSGIGYGTASGYIDSSTGDIPVSINLTGMNHNIVYTSFGLECNHHYTFIIDDSIKNVVPYFVEDNFQSPSSGKSNIRFLHLFKNSDNYTVSVDNSIIFTNRSFNDIMNSSCNYSAINSGRFTIDFNLTGTSTTVLSIPDVSFESGKSYTVVIYGSGSPGDKPNFKVINDN